MKPIRGERHREMACDAWHATDRQIGESDVAHYLSDDGAIESFRTGRRFACSCGCLRPAGGFCAECGPDAGPVCDVHLLHCHRCSKPLCLGHSSEADLPDGQRVRLCRACFEAGGRRRVARTIVRTLLSPFVRFED